MDEEQKNINFVQFSRNVMQQHRALIRKSPLAAQVLTFFIESMDKSNAVICSYKVLEEIMGVSRSTVARAVKVLRDDQWIQSIKIGTATAYIVNSAAFWSTHANGKQYSQFHASVIAAASEQEDTVENMRSVRLKRVPMWDKKTERPLIAEEDLPPPDQSDLDLN